MTLANAIWTAVGAGGECVVLRELLLLEGSSDVANQAYVKLRVLTARKAMHVTSFRRLCEEVRLILKLGSAD